MSIDEHISTVNTLYYELFKLTPEIIRSGHCFRLGDRKLMFVYASLTQPKKPYRSVVKATSNGEVYLDSTYRIQFSQARNSLRDMAIIARD